MDNVGLDNVVADGSITRTEGYTDYSHSWLEETDNDQLMMSGHLFRCKNLLETHAQVLEKKGFSDFRYVNSGATRHVFQATFTSESGKIREKRIIKIPKCISGRYIGARAEGNNPDNELRTVNKLKHDNLVRVYYDIMLEECVSASIEDKYDHSLKDEVFWTYRDNEHIINYDRLIKIYTGIIDGLGYLHKNNRVHRDIKPDNIWIINDKAVIGDLQTVKEIRDVESKCNPTRGSASYCHPKILNATFFDKSCCAKSTDLYSLCCTLYYSLTKRAPFDYKIKKDESGTEIDVENGKIKVSIWDGYDKIAEINERAHRINLEKALEQAPQNFEKLFRTGLAFHGGYQDIEDFKKDFEEATANEFQRFVLEAKRKIQVSAAAAVVGFFVGLGVYAGIFSEGYTDLLTPDLSKAVTLASLESRSFEAYFDAKSIIQRTLPAGIDVKALINNYLSERDPNIEILAYRLIDEVEIHNQVNFKGNIAIERNILTPLLISILASQDKILLPDYNSRTSNTLVPKKFRRILGYSVNDDEELELIKEVNLLAYYLNTQYQDDICLDDWYASALCSDQEKQEAVSMAIEYLFKNTLIREAIECPGKRFLSLSELEQHLSEINNKYPFSYCPRVNNNTILRKGYRDWINPTKRKIIDRAIVFNMYMNNGKLDLSNSQKNSKKKILALTLK